jgi:hypothetical protein
MYNLLLPLLLHRPISQPIFLLALVLLLVLVLV